jgi:hypothetical protein
MNPNFIGIFDPHAHLRAVLHWEENHFIAEGINNFDINDIKTFLSRLDGHDPRKRFEPNNAIYLISVPKNDPSYRNAVLQELGIQGIIAYPIEEYQKDFLVELNDAKFDKIRENMLGDILTISEEDITRFMADLKEGMGILEELRNLK